MYCTYVHIYVLTRTHARTHARKRACTKEAVILRRSGQNHSKYLKH